MTMLKIPETGLRCPLCGCTTLSADGAIDMSANEIDDSANFTCTSCGYQDNGNVFAERDKKAQLIGVLEHYDIAVPMKPLTHRELVAEYIDAYIRDIADTLGDSYLPKNETDLVCDRLRAYLEALFKASVDKVSVETGCGELVAEPSDAFDDVPAGIDVAVDGHPVLTVRQSPVNADALVAYLWNDDDPDADAAVDHAFYRMHR